MTFGPGPGGRAAVDPPRPLPPVLSLLNSADAIPPDPALGPHWLNGITYLPWTCAREGGAQPADCVANPSISLTDETRPAIRNTDAFWVWTVDHCSTLGWQAENYVQRVTDYFNANEPRLVEAEVWAGTAIRTSTNSDQTSYLTNASTVTVLNSGGAYAKLTRGLAAVQQALADCSTGGPGMIHMSVEVEAGLEQNFEVRRVNNQLLDGRDNLIVPGSGYPSAGHPDGQAAPDADHAWIIGTSRMRIWREDALTIIPNTYAEALDRSTNTIRFYAQRGYLVDWDRCCHVAALVPLTN